MPTPTTNADNLPSMPLTEEQRFLFDTRGWLLFPGVLSETEVKEMREYCYQLKQDPESLPAHHRSPIGGPLEGLTDHPVVLGFMNEFLTSGYANEDCYGFRFEGTFLTIRANGHDNFQPHGGRGMLNFPGNSHTYHLHHDKAHSGLTRVVWELNPVKEGGGGTMFLTGSHKGAFPAPKSTTDRNSPLWEDYSCPAGSMLVFTEAITHTGAKWIDEEVDRVALFHCYNTVGNKWHKWEPHPKQVEEMPFKRQTLFRPVHCQGNTPTLDAV